MPNDPWEVVLGPNYHEYLSGGDHLQAISHHGSRMNPEGGGWQGDGRVPACARWAGSLLWRQIGEEEAVCNNRDGQVHETCCAWMCVKRLVECGGAGSHSSVMHM